jgi:hypothetical protein
MRSFSSVLIQAVPHRAAANRSAPDPAGADPVAPKLRERGGEPGSLDSILRTFVEEGPRWRSRARRDAAGKPGARVDSGSREARSSR